MSQVVSGVTASPGEPVAIIAAMEPTPVSGTYRLGLLVVAAAMLLLPVLYVALIGLTGAGVWWHLTANQWLMQGRGTQWRLIAYLGPAIAGAVVMFFMVKPLLARPARRDDPVAVDPDEEPALFAFIQQICQQVRAPLPRRVFVDCQVNASASFLRGAASRDLVLTIGLPLVAGLSVRELGGVLAHEFGHFAQGGGMRLTAIVRGINGWFARVVYERDRWDETLARWSEEIDWRLAIVLSLARGAVWLSRRILTGLMWAGHAISCFMMRQMEYDADSYEVKLSGSEAFARTSARLRELSVASSLAYDDLGAGLRTRKAPANLPVYIAMQVDAIPSEVSQRLQDAGGRKTGIFDTHPSDGDRLRAAAAAAAPGVLAGGDGPATRLFRDFETLCARATRHHYDSDLALDSSSLALVDTADATMDSRRRAAGRQALQAVFGGCLSAMRPIRLRIPLEADAASLAAGAAAARTDVRALGTDDLSASYRRLEALEQRRTDAFTVETLVTAGFAKIDAASFGLTSASYEEASRAHLAAAQEQQALSQRFETFEEAAARWLSYGAALLSVGSPETTRHTAGSLLEISEETGALIGAVDALASTIPALVDIRFAAHAMVLLELNQESSANPALARSSLMNLGMRIQRQLRSAYQRLSVIELPADVAPGPTTAAAYCGVSEHTPPGEAAAIADRVWALYFDLLGRVARMALQAEVMVAAESSR